jgi:chitin deacetylase
MLSSFAQAGLAASLILVSLFSSVYAAVIPSHDSHAHHHVSQGLPDRWYHDDEHPVHALFRRQAVAPADFPTFPQVGGPTWSAAYPVGTPNSNAMPQAWTDALNNAVQAGQIPNIPPSVLNPQGLATYPNNFSPTSPQVCSGAYLCRIPGQIWDAPPGVLGVAFDDGPLPVGHSFPS